MTATGLGTMIGVQWRTHRRRILVWMVALVASMIATAAAVAGLYDTPEKIHTYAQAVTSGDSLVAINGRVEGIDSLGGVIQDEFGFLAAFLLPLLGISLVAQATRREEDAGRLELVLGGRVARHVPALAALIVASAAIAVTAVAFAAGLAACGVPVTRSVLYSASLGALAFAFAGLATLLAQATRHSRGVYLWSLLILAGAYVLRGVGDVTGTWVTWLSPLGWAEKAAAFGAMRWWTLLVPLIVGGLFATLGILIAGHRDLGSSLARGDTGSARASAWLRTPVGLATDIHRPAILGWLAGALILAGMMGALAQQFVDAVAGNPAMGEAIGMSGARPEDGFLAVTQLYLAIIATGYVVQAVGSLRAEETEGRLEPRLSGTLPRIRWLAAHGLVIVAGLAVIVVVSSIVLALTAAWSMSGAVQPARVLGAGLAYLPAELLVCGLALALFGWRPRALPVAWAAFAAVAFIGFLGPGLKLAGWVLDLSPTTHVGNPPLGAVEAVPLVVLGATAAALFATAASASVIGWCPKAERRPWRPGPGWEVHRRSDAALRRVAMIPATGEGSAPVSAAPIHG